MVMVVTRLERLQGAPITESFKRNRLLQCAEKVDGLAELVKQFSRFLSGDNRRNASWLLNHIREESRRHQEQHRRQQEIRMASAGGGSVRRWNP